PQDIETLIRLKGFYFAMRLRALDEADPALMNEKLLIQIVNLCEYELPVRRLRPSAVRALEAMVAGQQFHDEVYVIGLVAAGPDGHGVVVVVDGKLSRHPFNDVDPVLCIVGFDIPVDRSKRVQQIQVRYFRDRMDLEYVIWIGTLCFLQRSP